MSKPTCPQASVASDTPAFFVPSGTPLVAVVRPVETRSC